jgi:hypothetical protein
LARYAEYANIGGNKTGGYEVVKTYSNKDGRES